MLEIWKQDCFWLMRILCFTVVNEIDEIDHESFLKVGNRNNAHTRGLSRVTQQLNDETVW